MKVQYKILVSSVALALSGGAQAASLGAAHEVYISGATAPQNFLREDTILRLCDFNAAAINVYVDQISNANGVADVLAGDLLEQGDHFVVQCTTKTGFNDANLDAKSIAVYKFNGGSATGVAPVADATTVSFMDAAPANCSAPTRNIPFVTDNSRTYNLYECPNAPLVAQIPDAGVSDIEPDRFVGPLALNFGAEPVGVASKADQPYIDRGNLKKQGGPGLVFGVAVTLPLYDELLDSQQAAGMPWMASCPANPTRAQRDSVDCMPSLAKSDVTAVFTGSVKSWADFKPYGLTLDPVSGANAVAEGNKVYICKRTNGSGTHAQHSIEYMGTGCLQDSDLPMLEQNNGVAVAGSVVGVYANKGSSDMDDCLDALGTGAGFNGDFTSLPPTLGDAKGDSSVVPGTGLPAVPNPSDPFKPAYNYKTEAWAMGYNSLEKNTDLGYAYRFVRVNTVPPTLVEAADGNYTQTYYLSFQHRVDGSGKADPRTGGMRSTAANVAVLDAYFEEYAAIDPLAIDAVNTAFEVDPDGTAGSGDEWQGGFLTTVPGGGAIPATPNARQTPSADPYSCAAQAPVL